MQMQDPQKLKIKITQEDLVSLEIKRARDQIVIADITADTGKKLKCLMFALQSIQNAMEMVGYDLGDHRVEVVYTDEIGTN